jgi:branched-chain amino acid transport system substrate-binding protein
MNRIAVRLAGLALGTVVGAQALAADIKVGFITSLSGPVSALGIPYHKGIQAAQQYKATVAGRNVQLLVLDDASDPTVAARNARKLVTEDHVDVLIGTSGVPGALAIAAVARETGTPLISPTPVSVPANDNGWTVTVSQPFPLMVAAVVDKMKAAGVKRVAFIGFSDALGDLAYDSLLKAAEPAGIEVVANERYARGDSSVAGQVLKIVAARPDAVFAGNSGTPGRLPYLALAERGYKGQIYGTHGLITADFVRVGGAAATKPDGSERPGDGGGPAARRESGAQDRAGLPRRLPEGHGRSRRRFLGLHLRCLAGVRRRRRARRQGGKAEPGTPQFRQALHDAIAQTHELAGTHGIFNFKPNDPYGLDRRSAVVIRLDKGQWRLAP